MRQCFDFDVFIIMFQEVEDKQAYKELDVANKFNRKNL